MTDTSINRRKFVQRSSIYATAATQAALIGNRVSGANERVNIGVMGIGGRGKHLLTSFVNENDVSVAAICDVDDAHMKEGIQRTENQASGYKDFRRMLERNDLDAIVIATPDHWHAIPTIYACQAGKDVYVEKPIAHNLKEGQDMVKTASETNRIVQMGTQQRSASQWQEAVKIIQSGILGKISEIRIWNNFAPRHLGNPPDGNPPDGVDYDMWLGPAPKRPFNPNHFHRNALYFWDYAGGLVTSWGVHLLDIAYWAMQLSGPRSVSAVGGKFVMDDNRETPDTFSAVYQCDGFIMTYMMRHWNGLSRPLGGFGHSDHGIEFHGADGTIYIDRQGYELRGTGDQPKAKSYKGEYGTGAHVRNFLDCVKSRTKPNSSIELGLPPSAATFLANISYRTGTKIDWNAETETIIDNPDATKFLSRKPRKPW